jgi:hypothetical protein
VQLECDPVPEWRNNWESASAMPPRFRAENLWGMHLRVDALLTSTPDVQPKFGPPPGLTYDKMPDKIKDI